MIIYDIRLDGVVHEDVTAPFLQSGLSPGQAVAAEVRARDTEGNVGEWSVVTTAETPLPDATLTGVASMQSVESFAHVHTTAPDAALAGVATILPTAGSGSVVQSEPQSTLSGRAAVLAVEGWASLASSVGDRAYASLSGRAEILAHSASGRAVAVSGLSVHVNQINLQLKKAKVVLSVDRQYLQIADKYTSISIG